MSDLVLSNITSGYNLSLINSNFQTIQNKINNDCLQTNLGHNVMSQDLDMNSHSLLNLTTNFSNSGSVLSVGDAKTHFYQIGLVPTTSNDGDAVSYGQVGQMVAAGNSGIVPANVALYSELSSSVAGKGASLVFDAAKSSDLADTSTGKGASLIGYPDTLAPAFLKTTSDIINGERISVLRAISPAKYSAIRAGTDSSQLDADINSLLSAMSQAGYGDLYFPPGYYGLGGYLNLPSNIIVSGAPGQSWLRPEYDPSGLLLIQIANQSNVVIRGLSFDGRLSTRGAANFAAVVTVFASSDVVLDDCKWVNCKGIGASFSGGIARSGIRRGHFVNCGTYLLANKDLNNFRAAISYSTGTLGTNVFNFVEDTHFETIGLDCISIDTQSYFTASRNKINETYTSAIFDANSQYTSVIGNTINNCAGSGIDVLSSNFGNYANNIINAPKGAGVVLAGVNGSVVTGNTVVSANTGSIAPLSGAYTLRTNYGTVSNVSFSGNKSYNSLGWGFFVDGNTAMGDIQLDPNSNQFIGSTLGEVSGFDTAYMGAAGRKIHSVASGASITLMPSVGNSIGNYAIIEVLNANGSYFGKFIANGSSSVLKIEDPNAQYTTDNTGTTSSVYRDATSGNIKLANKTSGSCSYLVNIRGLGSY